MKKVSCLFTLLAAASIVLLSCTLAELPPDAKEWLSKYDEFGRESIEFSKTYRDFKERADDINRSNPKAVDDYNREFAEYKKKLNKHNAALEKHFAGIDGVVKGLNPAQRKAFNAEAGRIKRTIEKGKEQYK